MEAMRCPECGDVRWSFFGKAKEHTECEICGTEMEPERRRPLGARSEMHADDRRGVTHDVTTV